jgi:hypothetical protein
LVGIGPPEESGVCHHAVDDDDDVRSLLPEDRVGLPVRGATTAVTGSGVLSNFSGALRDRMNHRSRSNRSKR